MTLTLLTVTGCVTSSLVPTNPVPPVDGFCLSYVPVYSSVRDTEETKRQIDKNNAVWLERCPQPAPAAGPAPAAQ